MRYLTKVKKPSVFIVELLSSRHILTTGLTLFYGGAISGHS